MVLYFDEVGLSININDMVLFSVPLIPLNYPCQPPLDQCLNDNAQCMVETFGAACRCVETHFEKQRECGELGNPGERGRGSSNIMIYNTCH